MELQVHTGLMRMERRLYRVGDLELPQPVTITEAAVFLAALAALFVASRALGLGLHLSWAWAYLVLPWLAMRASRELVADRKRVHQWAVSQLRYLAEPRLLARLRAAREPAALRLRAEAWRPAPPRAPKPDAVRIDRRLYRLGERELPQPAPAGKARPSGWDVAASLAQFPIGGAGRGGAPRRPPEALLQAPRWPGQRGARR